MMSNGLQHPDNPASPQFDTAMIHLFRGEISRANVWRQRLDATTNWAVLTTGAALSLVFGQPDANHAAILLIMLLVLLFLVLEARRYRYYELWSARVRLLEQHYFAHLLAPDAQESDGWRVQLADMLRNPRYPLTMLEAIERRLRRNYLWIFLLLWFVWLLKVAALPNAAPTLEAFNQRAAIGGVSGIVVAGMGVLFLLALAVIALVTPRTERNNEIIPYDMGVR
ncbi:MAG: DUF2270 domain-containing protein [Chloroflexota bacterium]|nr:DUF2270 domain-containing protein [Chloroflexota bacterium]